jgi:hypothetical protein
MPSCEMRRDVDFVRNVVSEECAAPIFRVERISELGTLAVTWSFKAVLSTIQLVNS